MFEKKEKEGKKRKDKNKEIKEKTKTRKGKKKKFINMNFLKNRTIFKLEDKLLPVILVF